MVGWRETVSLREMGWRNFVAKVDTGARTTAIHATQIRAYVVGETEWVEFTSNHIALGGSDTYSLPLKHYRSITNTGGVAENRAVATTTLEVGGFKAEIEVSLTDRSNMEFPMIIGRTALRALRFTVDPSRSWLQSSKP